MTATLVRWARSGLSSFFSSRIEDSFRLRTLTLAGLWVTAMALAWVGGDLRYCLAGGVIGTVGHWYSYKMRYRPSRVRPLVIAVLIVALSVYLRNDMIKTFSGDWVPLGQYLVLVSGLSAFDVRTRGGLYTGLVLSGMVLFFASQQAFEYSFGVFVVGFVVVIMAFMVLAFLEDMVRTARVYWAKNSVATLVYWTGSICAMFLLAGPAFWVLPRGESNLAGPPQLAVLPYSASDLEQVYEPLKDIPEQDTPSPTDGVGVPAAAGPKTEDTPQTSTVTVDQLGGSEPAGAAGGKGVVAERFGGEPGSSQTEAGQAQPATSGGQNENQGGTRTEAEGMEDPVVMYVRSSVASYWRGLVLEEYDGARWFVSDLDNKMIESRRNKGTWYNRENNFSSGNINYGQTFYLRGNDDLPMVTGYRALRVVVNDEQSENALLGSGTSYGVISSLPKHTADQLRSDTAGSSPILALLPGGELEEKLIGLSEKIVAGSSSDFEKMGRIISYLNAETSFIPPGPSGLRSVVTLDEFLFQGVPGSVLDYASATVLLARAAGLPARVAAGYRPGVKDPLTGTYQVRESDRHAWAEVLFRKAGWVPFDGAPRDDLYYGQRPTAGLARLFLSGSGDDIYATLKEGPLEVFQALRNAAKSPFLWALGPAIVVALLIWRWFQYGPRRRSNGPGPRLLPYAVIPGDRRREIRKIYAEVERLIRRDSGTPRAGWQTAGHYASLASGRSPEIDSQLSWFTQAIWQAAYRTGELHAEVVTEGRRRLALLKKAFKASRTQKTG